MHDLKPRVWLANISVSLGETQEKVELRSWQWQCREEGYCEREDWEILVDRQGEWRKV